jgi:hypothetical protein
MPGRAVPSVLFGNLDEGVLTRTHRDKARALIVNSRRPRRNGHLSCAPTGLSGEILVLVEDPYHRQPIILAGATPHISPGTSWVPH